MPLSRNTLGCLAALCVAFFSASLHAQSANSDWAIAYATVLNAESNYVKAIGEARLAAAKAGLEDAKAAQKWQEVRQLAALVTQLEYDLKEMRRARAKLKIKIDRIEKQGKATSSIKLGGVNRGSASALRWMMRNVIPAATLFKATSEKTNHSFSGKYFYFASAPDAEIEDLRVEVVGDLIYYVMENLVSMRMFSPPHLAFLGFLTSLEESALEKIKKIEKQRQQVRDGTMDIWNPADAPAHQGPRPGQLP